jgi:hypothetical protein
MNADLREEPFRSLLKVSEIILFSPARIKLLLLLKKEKQYELHHRGCYKQNEKNNAASFNKWIVWLTFVSRPE